MILRSSTRSLHSSRLEGLQDLFSSYAMGANGYTTDLSDPATSCMRAVHRYMMNGLLCVVRQQVTMFSGISNERTATCQSMTLSCTLRSQRSGQTNLLREVRLSADGVRICRRLRPALVCAHVLWKRGRAWGFSRRLGSLAASMIIIFASRDVWCFAGGRKELWAHWKNRTMATSVSGWSPNR
jgi:hypothetical protein